MSHKKMPGAQARLLVHFCIGLASVYAQGALAQAAKVDVCHIPPGNPANAHTITISENALDTHLAHGDSVGACESAPAGDAQASGAPAESVDGANCACPRAGVWRVTNLDGYMECNVLGIKRKLRGAGENDGAIWILNDDCSTIFSEAYEKDREDVIMDRGRECLFFGVAPGEEEGAEVIFDGAYQVDNEEFITGEYYMEMSSVGADCSGYRPFEIAFLEPLDEKKYAKLEKEMQKQLEAARATQAEHSEQIDKYLEKTEGGRPFGGRNSQD